MAVSVENLTILDVLRDNIPASMQFAAFLNETDATGVSLGRPTEHAAVPSRKAARLARFHHACR